MIEFDAEYREKIKSRLPLIYFFARKRVVDPDNYQHVTVVKDKDSDLLQKRRTALFPKPITKIEL